ncbi:type II secretion system protein [bacterium]|nr:type II secretion system protein [bacterium]
MKQKRIIEILKNDGGKCVHPTLTLPNRGGKNFNTSLRVLEIQGGVFTRRGKGDKIKCKELNHLFIYSPIYFKKVAFTLAEVLITLGIIGVVAALTIPTLIANTRSQQYRSQFKKTISTLSQAGKMAKAQYDFSYGDIKDNCTSPASDNPESVMTICAIMNGTLKGLTYLGKLGEVKGKDGNIYEIGRNSSVRYYTTTEGKYMYALADGSIVGIGDQTSFSDGTHGGQVREGSGFYGFIDVNGFALPNVEVSCEDNSTTSEYAQYPSTVPCVVPNDAKHMTDVYPVWFQEDGVVPNSNAALYVLNTAK